jgi:hypothetical protein
VHQELKAGPLLVLGSSWLGVLCRMYCKGVAVAAAAWSTDSRVGGSMVGVQHGRGSGRVGSNRGWLQDSCRCMNAWGLLSQLPCC